MNATASASARRINFPAGYSGITVGTVRKLCELVRQYEDHPVIRARVRGLFADLPSMDWDGEIARVWRFVLDNVRYVRDPEGGEHVTTPVELDRQVDEGTAAEDCESLALYAGTLLAAAGYDMRFEIQGRRPELPDLFTHCSLAVLRPAGTDGSRSFWLSFDLVGAQAFGEQRFSLGDSLHVDGCPLEQFDLDGRKVGDMARNGLQAAFGDDAAGIASGILRGVGSIAPIFGPYGSIVGGVANVAGGIVDVTTGQPIANRPPIPVATPPGYQQRVPAPAARRPLTMKAGITFTHEYASALQNVNPDWLKTPSTAVSAPPLSSGAKTALGVGAALLLAKVLL